MFYKVGHSTSNSVLDKKWLGIHVFIAKIKFLKKVWKEKNFVPGPGPVAKMN